MSILRKEKRNNIEEKFLITILFLYCINFMNIGSYLPLLILPFLFIYILKEKFNISFLFVGFLLISFFISYSIFIFLYGYSNIVTILGWLIYPIMFYFFGYMLVRKDKDNYKKTVKSLFVIIIAFTMYGVLSTQQAISFYNGAEGIRNSVGRIGIDIWTKDIVSATALNAWLSLGLSLLPLLFLKDQSLKYAKQLKFISFICFSLSAYGVIQLGNRTGIVIIIVTFIVTLTFSKKINFRKILNLMVLGVSLFVILVLYRLNIFGVKYTMESSYLYYRFTDSSLTEDLRVRTWISAFQGLFQHPSGGKQTSMPLNSAHNLWLDVGYETGILPFMILLFFTLMTLVVLFQFINKEYPILLKGLMLSLYTSFILTFFVEPVLIGLNEYFTIFCLLIGIMYRLNQDFKYNDEKLRIKV